MSAKDIGNGRTLYRGHVIQLNTDKQPGRMGRYTAMGRDFSQKAHAKAWVDHIEAAK